MPALADDDIFNPDSPSEPGEPQVKTTLTLVADPEDGGSVSGGGRSFQSSVYVYASPSTGFKFVNWTREGEVVSTERNFYYTKQSSNDKLVAHFEFDPTSPAEPANGNIYSRLSVLGDDGFYSTSGSGRYVDGARVTVSASLESSFDFVCWQDEEGTVLSESRSFSYTMPTGPARIYAISRFNPDSPAEPKQANVVRITSGDGGYYHSSLSSGSHCLEPGKSLSLSAYPNSGYEFTGWYLNGSLYTTLSQFSYTMDGKDVNFHAEFRFNPDSPPDPSMPTISQYSYYLMSATTTPGSVIDYPLYLVNTEPIRDIDIRVTFPAGIDVSVDDYVLASQLKGYTVSAHKIDNPADLWVVNPDDQVYEFSLIGGVVPAAPQPKALELLTFKVTVPDEITTAQSYQVKLNQISMQQLDGTTITAHVRNGVIVIYKRGDANGDDRVSIIDLVMTNSARLGNAPAGFVPEAVRTDGELTSDDAISIADIILQNQ